MGRARTRARRRAQDLFRGGSAAAGAPPRVYLDDDSSGLAHLLHPHEVAVVAVARGADGDLEVEFRVNLVRLRTAKVPRHTRAA